MTIRIERPRGVTNIEMNRALAGFLPNGNKVTLFSHAELNGFEYHEEGNPSDDRVKVLAGYALQLADGVIAMAT